MSTCDACAPGLPGVVFPTNPTPEAEAGLPGGRCYIERCDLCGRYPDDDTAAQVVAEAAGRPVREDGHLYVEMSAAEAEQLAAASCSCGHPFHVGLGRIPADLPCACTTYTPRDGEGPALDVTPGG